MTFVADDLYGFMSFAGDEDRVARLGFRNRPANRLGSIGLDMQRDGHLTTAGQNGIDDVLGMFVAWVVAGDDSDVRCAGSATE